MRIGLGLSILMAPSLGALGQTISPGGIASGEAFGTPLIVGFITPTGIASAEAFGTPVVAGPIIASGIASAEAFGTPTLKLFITPTGIASAEAFGTPVLPILPDGIASAEAFGTASLVEAQVVAPSGIASAEAFGTAVVAGPITCTGIHSDEAFGLTVVAGPIIVSGIASAEAFGTPYCNVVQTVLPSAIASAEAFGTPRVSLVQSVLPSGIASAEAFGAATVASGPQRILCFGIFDGAVGTPGVVGGVQELQLFLGNVDQTDRLRKATGRVTFQKLGRATFEFDLFCEDSYTPVMGMTVILKEFNRKLFMGCIVEIIAERVMSSVNEIFYHCLCTDKLAILDHRVVNKTYTADQDAADVIRDIALNFLDGEGISTAGVPASLGTLGTELPLILVPVSNALDRIRDLTGMEWWGDVDGILYAQILATAPAAPFSITETSRNWRNLTVKGSLTDYRNKQYVKSNLQLLPGGSATPVFVGGPVRTENYTIPQPYALAQGFTLGSAKLLYPILAITKITVNGVEKPVVLGTDLSVDWSLFWYFFPGFPFVYAPTSGANVPSNGDLVEITYVPLGSNSSVQIGTVFTPPGGFGTCGSGIYEAVEQVPDVQYQDDADAIGAGILARASVVPAVVTFETDEPGLMPGQALHANIPRMLLNNIDLYVTQVTGATLGVQIPKTNQDTTFRWQIEASNIRDYGNWVKWYEKLIRRTDFPMPIEQADSYRFVVFPGGSPGAAAPATNPLPVLRAGKLLEVTIACGIAAQDQNIIFRFQLDGVEVLSSAGAVLPDGTATPTASDLIRTTTFAFDPYFASRDQIITISYSGQVTGPDPQPPSDVTVTLRIKV